MGKPLKMIQPEYIGRFMEGKTITEAYFLKGTVGLKPSCNESIIIKLTDGAENKTQVQIMANEIFIGRTFETEPVIEAYFEDRPEYFNQRKEVKYNKKETV